MSFNFDKYKDLDADELVDKMLDIARKELALGVKEDDGANEDKGGRIREYRRVVTDLDADPYRGPEAWCADFVSWCYYQVGEALGEEKQGFRACVRMLQWLRYIDAFTRYEHEKDAANEGKHPNIGDIILFDADNNDKPEHVGIIERVVIKGGKLDHLITIEGNYADKLSRVTRRRTMPTVYGFGQVI